MPHEPTFGRRRSAENRPPRPALRPPETNDPVVLGPQAEAFRNELAAKERFASDFAAWKRDRRGRRLVAWTLRLALFTPGVVCFILQTPWWVSGGLELAGIAIGWRLNYERRRHLREIAEWSSEHAES